MKRVHIKDLKLLYAKNSEEGSLYRIDMIDIYNDGKKDIYQLIWGEHANCYGQIYWHDWSKFDLLLQSKDLSSIPLSGSKELFPFSLKLFFVSSLFIFFLSFLLCLRFTCRVLALSIHIYALSISTHAQWYIFIYRPKQSWLRKVQAKFISELEKGYTPHLTISPLSQAKCRFI